jgi:hypothetical protein
MQLPDIFASNFQLPSKVCVVAPGPNGKDYYNSIPSDFCVIAVAKAILIPEVHADIWMMTHSHQAWYPEADAAFSGVRIYSYDAAMRVLPSLAGKKDCYYFKPHPELLDPHGVRSVEGVIRYGGTIVGNAIQLAYNFGAADILLCGADMSGDGYWDGTLNQEREHGQVWDAVSYLNPLLEWLRSEKGINISTLSPTKLCVPRRSP